LLGCRSLSKEGREENGTSKAQDGASQPIAQKAHKSTRWVVDRSSIFVRAVNIQKVFHSWANWILLLYLFSLDPSKIILMVDTAECLRK